MPFVGGVRVGGEHDGFTHAVALQNGVPCALLPFGECFNEQRSRTRHKQAHVAHCLLVQCGLCKHAHIQCGDAHEYRGLRHFGNHKFGIKLGKPNHFAAIDEGAVNGHKQTVHMENRQCVNEHIAFFPAPIRLEGLRIAQHVAMREHGALASASGATGVQNSGQIVLVFNSNSVLIFLLCSTFKQSARSVVIQGEHMLRASFECNFAYPAKVGTRTNHHRRFCVANEVLNLGTLIGCVQWQEHIACSQGGQIQHQGFHRLFHLYRNAAALGKLQAFQQVGHHGTGAV